MGTRADFYVGRGEGAEWIGSVAWDGYPDGISPGDPLLATTEDQFRSRLKDYFAPRDDVTFPDMGWPWPWETSHTTDYAYAFDGDRVWGSCFGHTWFDATQDEPSDYDEEADREIEQERLSKDAFPDMTSRKNVTLGKRSGVMVISTPADPS